jgi:RNA polymerase sigma-70 factor (ECF subfamily)
VGGDDAFDSLVRSVRVSTAAFLRTEAKTKLQALRDALPEDDRLLLTLRVDRRLEWSDLARVFHDGEDGPALDGEVVKREAARLRKRYQIVKDRLREAARREGLVD